MENKFLDKREILIIAALVIACAAAIILISLAPRGSSAAVYYDGELIQRIRLDRDAIYPIAAGLPVTLEVKDGAIRFINSKCPDHLCEGFGFIGGEHEYAICMPAKAVVMIETPD